MDKCHRCGCPLPPETAIETRSNSFYVLMCAPCSTNTDEGSRMTTVVVLGAAAAALAAIGVMILM
jgi:hypothetical protein